MGQSPQDGESFLFLFLVESNLFKSNQMILKYGYFNRFAIFMFSENSMQCLMQLLHIIAHAKCQFWNHWAKTR